MNTWTGYQPRSKYRESLETMKTKPVKTTPKPKTQPASVPVKEKPEKHDKPEPEKPVPLADG